MRVGSLLGVLCSVLWCLCVRCALLSSVGDSRLYSGIKIKDHLIEGGNKAVNTRIGVVGRKLLQTCPTRSSLQDGVCVCQLEGQKLVNNVCVNVAPPNCVSINGQCGCSLLSQCSVSPTSSTQYCRLSCIESD